MGPEESLQSKLDPTEVTGEELINGNSNETLSNKDLKDIIRKFEKDWDGITAILNEKGANILSQIIEKQENIEDKEKIIYTMIKNSRSEDTRQKIKKAIKDINLQDIPKPLQTYLEIMYKNIEAKIIQREEQIKNLIYMFKALWCEYDTTTGDLSIKNEKNNLFETDQNGNRLHNPTITTEQNGEIKILWKAVEIKETTGLTNQTINTYIWVMQLDSKSIPLKYGDINTYINNNKEPLTQQQLDDLRKLISMMAERQPTDQDKYKQLLEDIKEVKSTETQEQEAKKLETDARNYLTIAPSPDRAKNLLEKSENRPLANKIFELIKNNKITESWQQDNFVWLIKTYIWSAKVTIDINYKNLQSAIKTWNELPYNRPKTNKKWEAIYLIVLATEDGKILQLFPGTMEEVHDYRAQNLQNEKTITDNTWKPENIGAFKVYDSEKGIIDLQAQFNQKDFETVIKYAEEVWSYKAFAMLLETTSDPTFLKNNIAAILSAVKKGNEWKEGKEEHMNGYYKILAQQTINILHANPSDLSTLQAYLSFIKDDPSNIWSTKDAQIVNRNILAVYGDEKIKNNNDPQFKEIQDLYLECKWLIDPNGSKDLITQISDNVDKFFETFGPIISKLMEMFGYSKEDILKYLPSDSIRTRFLEQFQEVNQMTTQQKENFWTIYKSIKTNENHDTSKSPKERIEEYRNDKISDTVKTSLEKNFTLLSPWLIQNLINTYNKKNKENPINESNFIANGKVKDDVNYKEQKGMLITELLDPKNSMWNSILNTHDMILNNQTANIGSKEKPNIQNINSTTEDRSIKTFDDVTKYLAVYVVTFDKPPFKHAMAENNIIDKVNPPENIDKTPKKPYEKSLTETTEKLKKWKYNNPEVVSLPETYSAWWWDFVQYEAQILNPIQKLLDTDIVERELSAFSLTADNADFLTTLQTKPQVLKDLITYIANTKEEGEVKTKLENIAKLFNNESWTPTLESIKEIKRQEDGNILVEINDNKKFTIKPGPEFEIPASSSS